LPGSVTASDDHERNEGMTRTPTLRRALTSALVAAAVASIVGGVSIARAGAGHHGHTQTLVLRQVDAGGQFVDISHSKNGAPGDEAIFRSRLFDRAGHHVGGLDVVCTIIPGGRLQCLGTFTLPGGTLVGSAIAPAQGNRPVHIAISGGTGRYGRVRGQATSYTVSENTSRDVLQLSY
jgi:hypothetical protein